MLIDRWMNKEYKHTHMIKHHLVIKRMKLCHL